MNPQALATPIADAQPRLSLREEAHTKVAHRGSVDQEQRQRLGQRLILSGFVVTVVGIVLYCAVCFAGGNDADLGDILFRNAVPFPHATLGVLGLRTALWLLGSFIYLGAAIDLDGASESDDDHPPPQRC